MDPNVIIDRVTGLPTDVRVENQLFSIVKELHVSPVLFGRGTRVYMVRDKVNGHYHICKDSWILLSHAKDNSEIEHLKLISKKAKENRAKSPRAYLLHPRFVAGDGAVYNSNSTRAYATVVTPARIRRRMIIGPIGDPLTSYRSRVKCLQVFIDVADELVFLRDECGLLHGDISIGNIVIVRFLPNIIAACEFALTTIGPSNDPLVNDNHLEALGSGGAVIDFDYARSIKGKDSVKASGTVPYMSIELSRYLAGDPEYTEFDHRIDHDVESLLLVFLHIVRFTCGPKGNLDQDIFINDKELNLTQWHHERKIEQIALHKCVDVLRLRSARTLAYLLPAYWKPIAPHIIKLIDIVYPVPTIPLRTGSNIHGAFRKELEATLRTCQGLEEETHQYGTSMPFQTRAKKRKALTQGSIQQHIGKGTQSKRKKLTKKQ
ncbi:hypothetical protein HYPSUDRAFT_134901 [Hypholoma sublateritium FD-334 SS-4]|uniref:Fungal-type protein kinase domain-containing protein n=1 Tax=Hypholoma sublateritium (strain FD-334 SS-4) TaxID=945553 RepID=A0A0D2Q1J1_HYPSF|nr:hypothetical protein HYPSUDRAFT_134901 [Hypholoma sublateritium FD-334 SS-4]